MSIIKETREFFLRHTKENVGSKKDREYNFPLSYDVNIGGVFVKVFNRFLKGDYPNESIFKKLFESITFKLNVEDTAKTTEQGLVKKATDAQINLGSESENGFTLAVTPKQLPTVTGGTNVTVTSSMGVNGNKIYTISSSSSGGANVLIDPDTCEVMTSGGVTHTGGTTTDIIKQTTGSLGLANAVPQTVLSLLGG